MTGSRLLLLQAGAQLPLQPPAVPWDPESSCLSLEKGAQEKSWRWAAAAKDSRKFQEAGRSEQGMEGAGTSPGFFPTTSQSARKSEKSAGQALRELRQLSLFKFNSPSQK